MLCRVVHHRPDECVVASVADETRAVGELHHDPPVQAVRHKVAGDAAQGGVVERSRSFALKIKIACLVGDPNIPKNCPKVFSKIYPKVQGQFSVVSRGIIAIIIPHPC